MNELKVGDFVKFDYGATIREFYVTGVLGAGLYGFNRLSWCKEAPGIYMDDATLKIRNMVFIGPGIPTKDPAWWQFWKENVHPFRRPKDVD